MTGLLNVDEVARIAAEFRAAIERTRAEETVAILPYFPDGACKLVSGLLALHLRRRGATNALRFVSGHVPNAEAYVRHAWLLVDEVIVDLTADPFGEARVVVGAPTRFHRSLDQCEEIAVEAGIALWSSDETARYHRLLAPIEARVASFRVVS